MISSESAGNGQLAALWHLLCATYACEYINYPVWLPEFLGHLHWLAARHLTDVRSTG